MAIVDVFDEMAPADRVLLLDQATELSFGDGEAIIEQGQVNPAIYVVADGQVQVSVRTDEGEIELACLGLGAIFGEMAFLSGQPASATVVAVGPVELRRVDPARIAALAEAEPAFAGRFYRSLAVVLAERLRATNRRLI